ncbi:MAG: hypothetical protein HYU37_03390 [Acidobacteria bacterium]|nr:hypothetical protein [Acidobacteriota bacterium]
MPDASMISDWIQAIGVTAALVFTAMEFRARKKEQHFRNYLDGIAGFIDDTRMLVEIKDLHGLYDYSTADITASYPELSDVQRTRVHYCDLIIARCETVWLAADEGWVPKAEWQYWKTWMRQLGGSSEFRWTVEWVADDYSEEFISLVREEVKIAVQQFRSPANQPLQPTIGAGAPI